MKIMRLAAAAALVAALSATPPLATAAGAGEGPVFEPPLLITSAGQSPDVQLAVILAKRAGIEHTLSKLAVAKDLEGAKALGLVVGASLKGLGAAGIDTAKEKARVEALLAEAARKRTLDLADLKGGTFSITNVGAIGGDAATPIINYPETAILATMRISERVRAVGGAAVVRTVLPLCLSFDHRVVDGAEAARFMNDLIANLEDPCFLKDAAEGKGIA